MQRLGTAQFTNTPEPTHGTVGAAKASDGFVTDVNPLIRQLLLACEALNESPKWLHA